MPAPHAADRQPTAARRPPPWPAGLCPCTRAALPYGRVVSSVVTQRERKDQSARGGVPTHLRVAARDVEADEHHIRCRCGGLM